MCDGECSEYKDKDHQIEGRWKLGDWEFNRCPKSYVTENMDFWIKAFSMYKNGFLPDSGGWLRQTNKFTEVMAFIDAEISKHNQAVNNGRK